MQVYEVIRIITKERRRISGRRGLKVFWLGVPLRVRDQANEASRKVGRVILHEIWFLVAAINIMHLHSDIGGLTEKHVK